MRYLYHVYRIAHRNFKFFIDDQKNVVLPLTQLRIRDFVVTDASDVIPVIIAPRPYN